MIRDWFRTRRQLQTELAGMREQGAAVGVELAAAVGDREQAWTRVEGLKRELRQARLTIGDLLIRLDLGDRAVSSRPAARTAGQELAAMKAHAAALEERLHVLQQADMAADQQ